MPLVRDVFLFGLPFVSDAVVDWCRRAFTPRRDVTVSRFSVLLPRDRRRTTTPGETPVETPLLGQLPFQRPEIDPENEVLALPFSSGTTGLPKAVVCTHASSIAYVDVMAQCPQVQNWPSQDEAVGLETNRLISLFFQADP